MTAIGLLVALAAGATAYYMWADIFVSQGAPLWCFIVGAPIAYIVPVCFVTTLWLFLSWLWRTPRPPGTQLGIVGIVRLYVTEARAIATSWVLMILHRLLVREPRPAPASLPLLLIHGVLVNDGVWLGFRRFLNRRGLGPVYTINYGPPYQDIEYFTSQLAARIDGICAATGASRVMLIGHSMGGLVARAYIRRHGMSRVAHLVSIGTPHHGSRLAWLWFGRCLAQMRPGNAWLAALNADEHPAGSGTITSIWSRHDSMVAPQASAVLGAAANVAVIGIGHNALLGSQEVKELTAAEVSGVRSRIMAESSAPEKTHGHAG